MQFKSAKDWTAGEVTALKSDSSSVMGDLLVKRCRHHTGAQACTHAYSRILQHSWHYLALWEHHGYHAFYLEVLE